MITWNNYEEYMMMHADGELKPAEEQELMNFIFEHPELQNELAAFSMTKLIPDNTITYSKKDTLTKPEHTTKTIPFPNWKRSAIAASVVALVCFSFYKATMQPEIDQNLTNTNITSTTTIAGTATNSYHNKTNENKNSAASTTYNTIPNQMHENSLATVQQPTKTKKNTAAPKSVQIQNSNQVEIANNVVTHTPTVEAIDKIEPLYANLTENEKNNFDVAVTKVPDVTIYIDKGQTSQSFLDKLPIDELKKEGMENVASALASGYDKVNALRHSLSESSITLKLQNKKLTVSF